MATDFYSGDVLSRMRRIMRNSNHAYAPNPHGEDHFKERTGFIRLYDLLKLIGKTIGLLGTVISLLSFPYMVWTGLATPWVALGLTTIGLWLSRIWLDIDNQLAEAESVFWLVGSIFRGKTMGGTVYGGEG